MLEPTACRFWQAALQSGLMDAQGLRACWDALPPEKRTADAIDRRLARQAVQEGRLTLWQAQQLVAGRSTGFKIDRYILLELIGQGGMGRVYLARDTRLNRQVAIKILSPERVNNPRAIARFHREAMVGAQLQHENLVRIYDEGEANGRCYLVMEYIEGRNIGQMIAEGGPLPPPVAARLARQVALGLEHAQRKGLIHRDVNPYNILVTREGSAKLTDLGLAIDLADQERVTRDGATVGTFDYVSPEQARHSHAVDTRSDIYSLGCTLYHMLAGRVPFPNVSLPEKLFGHQSAEPESLTSLVPGLPAGLAAVVSRMMRKVPADRYATPLELAQALEPYADDAGQGLSGDLAPLALSPLPAPGAMAPGVVSPSTTSGSHPPRDETAAIPSPAGVAAAAATLAVAPPLVSAPASAPPVPPPSPASPPVEPTAAAPAAGNPVVVPVRSSSRAAAAAGLNLGLDLGPEAPLSDSLTSTRAKARAKDRDPGRSANGREGTMLPGPTPGWLAGHRPVAAAVAGVGLMLVVAALALWSGRGGGDAPASGPGVAATTSLKPRPTGVADANRKGGSTTAPSGSKAAAKKMPAGKEVAVVAADGTMTIEPDLATAVRAAIGSRGHVLLLNARPIEFSADETIVAGGGHLTIRAGEGVRPVLKVVVKGRRPFLLTRSDATLKLDGVTIQARYVASGPEPAPVIEAGAGVTLDRCEFRAEPEAGGRGVVPGARAVLLEGGTLQATGCLFENFARGVDASCYAGVTVGLKHCLFLDNGNAPRGATAPAGSEASEPGGWAVRLRAAPGGFGRTGRRLTLDRCTVDGRGLLDLAGFTPSAPLSVDATGNAVLAEALIAWEAPADAPPAGNADAGRAHRPGPGRDTVSWRGANNLFDVRGSAWIVVGPKDGPYRPLEGGPTDLAAWDKALGSERDAAPPPLRFAVDPAARGEHPASADFAVADHGLQPVGADPAQIGPTGRRPATRPGS